MRFTKAPASFVLLAVTVLLLVPGMLFSQSATKGAVSGTVTDASNAVVSGTTVTLRNLDKGGASQTVTARKMCSIASSAPRRLTLDGGSQ